MRRALAIALALSAASCVEFSDPTGLGLGRNTIISVSFDLHDGPPTCGEPVFAPAPDERMAGLCVQGVFRPGLDRFGAPLEVGDDTLWAMGVPIAPVVGEDGARFYARGFLIPAERLADTVYTARFPRLAGQPPPVDEVRWTALEHLGPDTLYRAPGEGIRLLIEVPTRLDDPPPGFRSWQVLLAGSTTAVYNGFWVAPRTAYEFPAAVVDSLGGPVTRAEMRWRRQYSPPGTSAEVQLAVSFEQLLRWTIVEVEP